jgi:prolyl-tRNA editing enzyme YbaK/EbsC (Cys-tRNA(Pro) deacylase)
METIVTKFLSERSIPYTIKKHSSPAFTSEDAAKERGVRLSQIVKCMVGVDDKGGLHVMLIPGDRILKLKRVRSIAGGIRIDLIASDRLQNEFDVVVGAMSPTQFFGKARFYIDNTVMNEENVDISSGDPSAGVELKAVDLVQALGAMQCDIVSTSER